MDKTPTDIRISLEPRELKFRGFFAAIKGSKRAARNVFLCALQLAWPITVQKLLTDKRKEFTDQLFATCDWAPSGNHAFDQLCQAFGIEHHPTPPGTPKTSGMGMLERINGHIVRLLKIDQFTDREDLQ